MAVTIPVCFWCGKDMFDAGRFPGDEIARVVAGYGFCDDCKAACRGKIICIEVDTPEQTGNPPLQKEAPLNRVSPTGRWVTLTTQEVKETPFPPGVMALAMEAQKALLERAVFENLFPAQEEPASGGKT